MGRQMQTVFRHSLSAAPIVIHGKAARLKVYAVHHLGTGGVKNVVATNKRQAMRTYLKGVTRGAIKPNPSSYVAKFVSDYMETVS